MLKFSKKYFQIVGSLVLSGTMGLLVSCGGGAASSSSGSSDTDTDAVTVSSLTSIPDIASMVSADGSSASMSALIKNAVVGTAPLLTSITTSNADTYFWNGLIADINTNGADAEDGDAFFKGEGKCRMEQGLGYSFQNIQQAGTSLCYMKNMPGAASGVSVASGGVEPEVIFDQVAATKIVEVQVSGEQGEDDRGEQNIFIKVYGSSSTEGAAGYAVDLWFCGEGSSTPRGYEKARINSAAKTFTTTNAETSFGSFVMQASASLISATNGDIEFDPDATKTASVFFSHSEGEDDMTFKSVINIDSDVLTTKNYGVFGDSINKNYTVSQFSGSSLADLRFLQAGFAGESSYNGNEQDPYYGATEYQTSTYADILSGTYYDLVNDYDFSADSFYGSDNASYATLLAAVSDYSCDVTPDIVVTMDFSNTDVQAVAADCESGRLDNMDFCDGEAIQTARQAMFTSFAQQQGPDPSPTPQ